MRETLVEIVGRLLTATGQARGGTVRRSGIALGAGLALLVVVVLVAAAAQRLPSGGVRQSPTTVSAAGSGSPGGPASASYAAGTSVSDTAGTALPLPASPSASASLQASLPACLGAGPSACPAVPRPSPFPSMDAGTRASVPLHVPILEYHRVAIANGETGFAAGLITPPAVFEQQMQAMSDAGWTAITMGQLGDDLHQGRQPAYHSFVVTFDDGYEDGYTNALPVLRSKGFVATFFVIASRIGTPGNLTVLELRELVAAGNEIGNHSWSHTDLEAKTPEQLVQETIGASGVIARDAGAWPKSYSYPLGLRDSQVIAAVSATPGIETAVVQEETRVESWATRLELPRIRVGPSTYPLELVYRASRYQP